MKKYIDVKSKKVYNEGDLYTFVKECKECGVYCKNITKFTINDDTLKLAEGRLEKVEENPRTKTIDRAIVNGLFKGTFLAIEHKGYNGLLNRMIKVSPKSAISYIIKEVALGVEHIMNYKGHIKDVENPYFIYICYNQDCSVITWEVKKWEKGPIPFKNFAFFRDRKAAELVAEETCNIFNSILNKNGK